MLTSSGIDASAAASSNTTPPNANSVTSRTTMAVRALTFSASVNIAVGPSHSITKTFWPISAGELPTLVGDADRQYRYWRGANDAFCDAPEQEAVDAGAPVSPHDDEVDTLVLGVFDDFLGG